MHKDFRAMLWRDEVGSSGQASVIQHAPQTQTKERAPKNQFGRCVLAAYAAHVVAAPLRCDFVDQRRALSDGAGLIIFFAVAL